MPETIEAEVLEIDGSPPPAPREPERENRRGSWDSVRGGLLRLDRRWWPLWVLLGIVAVGLFAVLGVFVAVVLLAARLIGSILRFFVGGPAGKGGGGISRTMT